MSTTLMRTISVPSPRVHGSPTSCATTPGASAPTGRSTSRATAGASASRYARCPNPGDAGGPARTDAAMRLPEAFRSLRYRDFRVFFVAQTISQIATWVHSVAQTWLILSLTNSPLLLGLITMLHWGPILLLALPSGAFTLGTVVSRQPPRALLDASAAAACSVLLALCLIESVWLAAVALFLLGYTGVITSAGCQTSLRLRSSDELLGPVMSIFTLSH